MLPHSLWLYQRKPMQLFGVFSAIRFMWYYFTTSARIAFFLWLALSLLYLYPPANFGNSKKKHAYFRPFICKSMTSKI